MLKKTYKFSHKYIEIIHLLTIRLILDKKILKTAKKQQSKKIT
jgi:hypothetical protein